MKCNKTKLSLRIIMIPLSDVCDVCQRLSRSLQDEGLKGTSGTQVIPDFELRSCP